TCCRCVCSWRVVNANRACARRRGLCGCSPSGGDRLNRRSFSRGLIATRRCAVEAGQTTPADGPSPWCRRIDRRSHPKEGAPGRFEPERGRFGDQRGGASPGWSSMTLSFGCSTTEADRQAAERLGERLLPRQDRDRGQGRGL